MLDFEGIGRQAGRTVNEVLHGAASASANASASAAMPNVLNVDWRQVRRWGIDARAVPGDAAVHFREPGLWDAHRREVLIALAVMLVQAGLIAGLVIERRRRKRAVHATARLFARLSVRRRTGGGRRPGPPVVVAQAVSGRATGVPHMVRVGDRVMLAWRGDRVLTAAVPIAAIQP